MKITVLCSDSAHPVNSHLQKWIKENIANHTIELVRSRSELTNGDFLFLVSCSEIIKSQHREKYEHTLVLHASDLPQGRGWSPHVWEIVNGGEAVTLSLLEAEDKVDTGRLWLKSSIPVSKTALWWEINQMLFDAETDLMQEAVERYEEIGPYSQRLDVEPTYYQRRTPADSELDPQKTIAEQFDLMRMCDPQRYPAWCEILGQKYKVILEKLDHE